MQPLIADGTVIFYDPDAEIDEWDLAAIRDGDRVMVKQMVAKGDEVVLLSTLPPLRLKDRPVLGKVVAVSTRPKWWARWLLRRKIAAGERESREFTELCIAKMREVYRTEHPTFPTWEPQRLQWA